MYSTHTMPGEMIDDYAEVQMMMADSWPVFHIIGRDGLEHGSSRSPVTAHQIADNIGGHVTQDGKPPAFFGGYEDDLAYLPPPSMVKCTKENEMDYGDVYDLCRVCNTVEVSGPNDTCEGCRRAREEGLYPPEAQYRELSEDVPGAWDDGTLKEEVGW